MFESLIEEMYAEEPTIALNPTVVPVSSFDQRRS
jgi:hypothetical protein